MRALTQLSPFLRVFSTYSYPYVGRRGRVAGLDLWGRGEGGGRG